MKRNFVIGTVVVVAVISAVVLAFNAARPIIEALGEPSVVFSTSGARISGAITPQFHLESNPTSAP